jgi:kynurenine 3-monooxygenase
LIGKHHGATKAALNEYSVTRNPNAEAICDLAIYNYEEMRSSVSSPIFRLRHFVEGVLGKLLPKQFIPLYTMVAFTEIPYAEVQRRWKSQTRGLNIAGAVLFGTSLVAAGIFGLMKTKTTDFKVPQFWSSKQ